MSFIYFNYLVNLSFNWLNSLVLWESDVYLIAPGTSPLSHLFPKRPSVRPEVSSRTSERWTYSFNKLGSLTDEGVIIHPCLMSMERSGDTFVSYISRIRRWTLWWRQVIYLHVSYSYGDFPTPPHTHTQMFLSLLSSRCRSSLLRPQKDFLMNRTKVWIVDRLDPVTDVVSTVYLF